MVLKPLGWHYQVDSDDRGVHVTVTLLEVDNVARLDMLAAVQKCPVFCSSPRVFRITQPFK
jgi:hypothetical protein